MKIYPENELIVLDGANDILISNSNINEYSVVIEADNITMHNFKIYSVDDRTYKTIINYISSILKEGVSHEEENKVPEIVKR